MYSNRAATQQATTLVWYFLRFPFRSTRIRVGTFHRRTCAMQNAMRWKKSQRHRLSNANKYLINTTTTIAQTTTPTATAPIIALKLTKTHMLAYNLGEWTEPNWTPYHTECTFAVKIDEHGVGNWIISFSCRRFQRQYYHKTLVVILTLLLLLVITAFCLFFYFGNYDLSHFVVKQFFHSFDIFFLLE